MSRALIQDSWLCCRVSCPNTSSDMEFTDTRFIRYAYKGLPTGLSSRANGRAEYNGAWPLLLFHRIRHCVVLHYDWLHFCRKAYISIVPVFITGWRDCLGLHKTQDGDMTVVLRHNGCSPQSRGESLFSLVFWSPHSVSSACLFWPCHNLSEHESAKITHVRIPISNGLG